jgi:dTDP-4-amino-4,6-dideoxygalactose transaminase
MSGAVHEPAGLRAAVAAELCDTYAARLVLLVGSGTEALQLALAGIHATVSGRAIALPAYSCYDLATAAIGAGVDVLLYDLDPATLGPEETSLARVLEGKPAAIVAAHLYGYPVDMRALERLSRQSGAVLVEDAAQAAGGRFHGAPLGSFGSVSVLSFGRGKGTTAGAGGALLAHDDVGERLVTWASKQLTAPPRGWREAATLTAQWALGRPGTYGVPASIPYLRLGETVYHAPRMPRAMSAASLRALSGGLRRANGEVAHRRSLAERLAVQARRSRRVHVVESVDGAEPGFVRLPLRANGGSVTDVVGRLGSQGAAAAYPAPLALLSPLRVRLGNADAPFPGARTLADTLFTFPTHSLVRASDIEILETWLAS